jgi:hypothetical protein
MELEKTVTVGRRVEAAKRETRTEIFHARDRFQVSVQYVGCAFPERLSKQRDLPRLPLGPPASTQHLWITAPHQLCEIEKVTLSVDEAHSSPCSMREALDNNGEVLAAIESHVRTLKTGLKKPGRFLSEPKLFLQKAECTFADILKPLLGICGDGGRWNDSSGSGTK